MRSRLIFLLLHMNGHVIEVGYILYEKCDHEILASQCFPPKTGFYNEIQAPKVKISPRGFSYRALAIMPAHRRPPAPMPAPADREAATGESGTRRGARDEARAEPPEQPCKAYTAQGRVSPRSRMCAVYRLTSGLPKNRALLCLLHTGAAAWRRRCGGSLSPSGSARSAGRACRRSGAGPVHRGPRSGAVDIVSLRSAYSCKVDPIIPQQGHTNTCACVRHLQDSHERWTVPTIMCDCRRVGRSAGVERVNTAL